MQTRRKAIDARGEACVAFERPPEAESTAACNAHDVIALGDHIVGVEGIEPPTSSVSWMRSNQLSHTPVAGAYATSRAEWLPPRG